MPDTERRVLRTRSKQLAIMREGQTPNFIMVSWNEPMRLGGESRELTDVVLQQVCISSALLNVVDALGVLELDCLAKQRPQSSKREHHRRGNVF